MHFIIYMTIFKGDRKVTILTSDVVLVIVKDKAYTLKTSDTKARAELAKLAGKMATIVGDVTGDTMTVSSVMMAK